MKDGLATKRKGRATRPSRRRRDSVAFKIHPGVRRGQPVDLTNVEIATTADRSFLPGPDDEARYVIERNALGADFSAKLRRFFKARRFEFVRGGVEGGRRRDWELADIGELPLLDPLCEKTFNDCDRACDALDIPRFEVDTFEAHAVCFHHTDQFQWHTDHYESSDYEGEETRTITFCYYFQNDPRMFKGGEMEFFDGTVLPHEDDMLLWIYPYQVHRVREVECWSPEFLDGRWAISGWLHRAPEDL